MSSVSSVCSVCSVCSVFLRVSLRVRVRVRVRVTAILGLTGLLCQRLSCIRVIPNL